MKKIVFVITLLALVLCPLYVWASPFLTCAPYAAGANQPTHFAVSIDGGAYIESTATIKTDGTAIAMHDLSGVTVGSHTARMRARIKDPVWGDSESADSSPFTFTRPVAPAVPTSVSIVK